MGFQIAIFGLFYAIGRAWDGPFLPLPGSLAAYTVALGYPTPGALTTCY